MSIVFERVALLLRIVHDTAGTPALSNLAGLATSELAKMNTEAGEDLAKAKAAEDKKAAEAQAKADAEARKEALKEEVSAAPVSNPFEPERRI